MTIPLQNPVEKQSLQKQKERKECKKNLFKENIERKDKGTKENTKDKKENNTHPDNKHLLTVIKQLKEVFKKYEETTEKEIKNIKEIIDKQYEISTKQQEKLKNLEKEIVNKYVKVMDTVKDTEIILQNFNQIKQNEQRLKLYDKAISKSFIHNEWKHKNGVAMLQYGIDKYVRVPVIPRYKFNKYNRRWIKEYICKVWKKR